ncbi:IclR family transcriptional regulator domain-containing protein [Dietzia sp.]|uniref:IclR family transcriptional regulator domain-containing protein n=1 Tax=Dietzia sp. TaxID=1871616 RepID=UPI002FD9B0A8
MAAEDAKQGGDFVQSLARGLAVIRAFDAARPRQSLSQVAAATGLSRSTSRRFLLTLVELGYVGSDGSRFWLTPKVLDLGYSYLSSMPLTEVASPHLERLRSRLGESSSVAIFDGSDIVYVARVQVRRIMTVDITIGTRFPAYATSMGKVLLSGLREAEFEDYLRIEAEREPTASARFDAAAVRRDVAAARTRGWSMTDQELEPGLRSLAAPIKDESGDVVAAVNVSTHAMRYTLDELHDDFVPALLAAAEAIRKDLSTVNR